MSNQPQTPTATVLYIEAYAGIRTWAVPILEKLGCRVIEAPDLKTAQDSISENQPIDLVILGDISRPVPGAKSDTPVDEMGLLLKLRATPAYREVPVILATSVNWLAEEAYQAGATAHLIKPFNAEQFWLAVMSRLPAGEYGLTTSQV